jgi:hypothetical protein
MGFKDDMQNRKLHINLIKLIFKRMDNLIKAHLFRFENYLYEFDVLQEIVTSTWCATPYNQDNDLSMVTNLNAWDLH